MSSTRKAWESRGGHLGLPKKSESKSHDALKTQAWGERSALASPDSSRVATNAIRPVSSQVEVAIEVEGPPVGTGGQVLTEIS